MNSVTSLEPLIERGWENRELLAAESSDFTELKAAVQIVIDNLDKGVIRVSEKKAGVWTVNQWIKKAVLLSFRFSPMALISGAPDDGNWWDKVPHKFAKWTQQDFAAAGFRAVPGSIVRRGAYIAPNVVLLPSFVNIGAFVGKGTMIDAWATVGSCAQIGENCHISGGTGIGGVLEPIQASPVIIEDNVFIGARAEIAEGVIVETNSVIGMGVFISASTKVIDRNSGEVFYGRVPEGSVVVSGSLPSGKSLADGTPAPSLYCAVIVKRVDAKTRAKTGINELLRD